MTEPARQRRIVPVAIAALAVGGWLAGTGAAGATSGSTHSVLYVSPTGATSNAGRSCASATFTSIGAAVAAVPTGGTVVVCHGTYTEDVLINKSMTLAGRRATIDATNLENAVQVVASHVTVRGLTLKNANGEGLLVGIDSMADAGLLPKSSPVLNHVTVRDVIAKNDDRGFSSTGKANCKYPGDCGGGIHLNVVKWSEVVGSQAVGNADGILLTDDYGPNAHNLVANDYVADNKTECGIVLPSHSTTAVSFDPKTFVVTAINPSMGGVYDNVVRDNVVLRNGTAPAPAAFGGIGGSGSGVGVFGSGPGAAAYNNTIEDNFIAGSGMAGFTIHAHHPGGEDVNGNRVIGNTFGTNNLLGDAFDGPPVMDLKHTAIAVFSVPQVSMTIADNSIWNNTIGIWLSTTVHAKGLSDNAFHNVAHHVVRG